MHQVGTLFKRPERSLNSARATGTNLQETFPEYLENAVVDVKVGRHSCNEGDTAPPFFPLARAKLLSDVAVINVAQIGKDWAFPFFGHRKHLGEVLAHDYALVSNLREQTAITGNLAA